MAFKALLCEATGQAIGTGSESLELLCATDEELGVPDDDEDKAADEDETADDELGCSGLPITLTLRVGGGKFMSLAI